MSGWQVTSEVSRDVIAFADFSEDVRVRRYCRCPPSGPMAQN
jgi:hypothetical protein